MAHLEVAGIVFWVLFFTVVLAGMVFTTARVSEALDDVRRIRFAVEKMAFTDDEEDADGSDAAT